MSAHKAAHPELGAPTVPSVSRLLHHPSPAHPPGVRVTRHKVLFTASLREYYPIWLKGLLLCMFTCGLYYPWARAQRLRYLLGHTVIAGSSLSLHLGTPAMVRLRLMQTLFAGLALGSIGLHGLSRLVALAVLLVLSPVILFLSQQTRLTHTSWQGHALRFTGTLGQAARLVWAPLGGLATVAGLSLSAARHWGASHPRIAGMIATVPVAVALYALLPYVWWHLQRYQQGHLAWGALRARFRGSPLAAGTLFVKTGLVAVASMTLASGLFLVLLLLAISSLPAGSPMTTHQVYQGLWPALALFVGLSGLIPHAYFVSRAQNLVWTETGNEWLRFKSALGVKPLLALSLKNTVLTALTLGLYWPAAQLAWWQLRLSTVQVHTRLAPPQWQPSAEIMAKAA